MDEPFYLLVRPDGAVFRLILRTELSVWVNPEWSEGDPIVDWYYPYIVQDAGSGIKTFMSPELEAYPTREQAFIRGMSLIYERDV